jgi:hypothetical protein
MEGYGRDEEGGESLVLNVTEGKQLHFSAVEPPL